jgi:putative transposase
VKTQDYGAARGYDGNKKAKRRKRHAITNILGNLLELVVSAANLSDIEGAKQVLSKLEKQMTLRLLRLWADQIYQGDLEAFSTTLGRSNLRLCAPVE